MHSVSEEPPWLKRRKKRPRIPESASPDRFAGQQQLRTPTRSPVAERGRSAVRSPVSEHFRERGSRSRTPRRPRPDRRSAGRRSPSARSSRAKPLQLQSTHRRGRSPIRRKERRQSSHEIRSRTPVKLCTVCNKVIEPGTAYRNGTLLHIDCALDQRAEKQLFQRKPEVLETVFDL